MDLLEQLKRDEGTRLKPYRDSVGKLTIGTGRNLDDVGISQQEADDLLANDIARASQNLSNALPWTDGMDYPRRCVLINMAFNMGIQSLLQFKNTLNSIQAGKYDEAANQMLLSKWATQVGPRAVRLAKQMRTGDWQ